MKYIYDVWATPTIRIVSGGTIEADAPDSAALAVNNLYPKSWSIVIAGSKYFRQETRRAASYKPGPNHELTF